MIGKHDNHVKIHDIVWDKLKEHIEKIPKCHSYYTLAKSQRLYFEDSTLNMSVLYKTFLKICEQDGLPLISFTCFNDHYNLNYNYGFVLPRTDVCNDCYQNLSIGEANLTEQQRLDFNLHLKQVQDFKKIKSQILENLCDKLIIEIDYCQNKSLPSLPVADNFYARKFWLFLCNVHVHNTK